MSVLSIARAGWLHTSIGAVAGLCGPWRKASNGGAVSNFMAWVADGAANTFTVDNLTKITRLTRTDWQGGSRTNYLVNAVWAGTAPAPTNWTAWGTGGTPTASIYGVDAAAYAFTSSAAQNFIYQNYTVLPNTQYCFSALIEDIDMGATSYDVLRMIGAPAGATVSFPVCSANPSGEQYGQLQPGVMMTLIQVGAAGGSVELRAGCGCGGPNSGTSVLSRPQFEIGTTRTGFIPTTTAAVTVYDGSPTLLYATARTNHYPTSEWQIANTSAHGGSPDVADTTLVVPGYGTIPALSFPDSSTATQYAYETITTLAAGDTVSLSMLVKTSDSSQPIASLSTTIGTDFRITCKGLGPTGGTLRYVDMGSGVWKVILENTVIGSTNNFYGIARYTGQWTKGLVITAMHIEKSSVCGAYLKTTTAPVTVTDYALASEEVTLGETPVADAVFTLDGDITTVVEA